jgi:hypothetical protein
MPSACDWSTNDSLFLISALALLLAETEERPKNSGNKKMKLGAAYNVFDGEELLCKSE